MKADLVGCHGQTLYHQGERRAFLGRNITTTWQTGEASIIAARVGVPVVSDFRPADMAAGGKGAPLVPYLDYLWFRDAKIGRIVQNIGGIAQSHRYSCRRSGRRRIRLRHWAGEHGDRCGHGEIVQAAVRSWWQDCGVGRNLGVRGRADVTPQVFSDSASEDRGARGIWAGICAGISYGPADGRGSKMLWQLLLR